MGSHPLVQLSRQGQSPWLDFIKRSFIEDGSLQKLIDEDDLRGVTSNPAIFEQAINQSSDYDVDIAKMTGEGLTAMEIYDRISIEDVGAAADLFLPVYEKTDRLDGYVSLEVAPDLATDTERTLSEARRLWKELGRPNVMIKVPATVEGIPAIEALIADGINVNVTLLFSVERYRAVAEAYIRGIKERIARGGDPVVASVASFFVSRVDAELDPQLEKMEAGVAHGIVGEVAIANSRLAYQVYMDLFEGEEFAELVTKGARTQRLLWASTSAKNPAYSPVKYVETLVAEDTVNTMPLATIDAYRDMGKPEERVRAGMQNALVVMDQLNQVGIDIEQVAAKLEAEGIEKFVQPFEKLIAAIEDKRQSVIVG